MDRTSPRLKPGQRQPAFAGLKPGASTGAEMKCRSQAGNFDVRLSGSRSAGRKILAQRFSAGKHRFMNPSAPGTAQPQSRNQDVCRPRGTRSRIVIHPTVETVGFHLSRPRRSCRPAGSTHAWVVTKAKIANAPARQGGTEVSPGRNPGSRQPPHLRWLEWLSPG
jgi:hypothetical protein